MMSIHTHYDNLKVARDAPEVVIKAAYKALIQHYHPDKSDDKDAAHRITKMLNEARDVLLDARKRKEHDDWIARQELGFYHSYSNSAHSAAHDTAQQRVGHFQIRDGIATDVYNKLVWCRFALGQTWRDGSAMGEAGYYNWQQAMAAISAFNAQGGFAGYHDWRIPTVDELETLIDKVKGGFGNYIDAEVFPNNNGLWFWSCSAGLDKTNDAWVVSFFLGDSYDDNLQDRYAVRLVRFTG